MLNSRSRHQPLPRRTGSVAPTLGGQGQSFSIPVFKLFDCNPPDGVGVALSGLPVDANRAGKVFRGTQPDSMPCSCGVVLIHLLYMKAKFGMIVVAGSGKIGGHVASRNRGGTYFRTKVTPVNPQTTSQLNSRNRLTTRSQAWRGLTQAQRDAWNGAVANFARTDIFGDLKNPTGFNLYQKLNNNLVNVGQAVLTLPPVPSAILTVLATVLAPAAGAGTLALTLSAAVPAATSVKVFATAPQSPGVSFVKSEYRQISILPAATATPVALGAAYVAKFGSWLVNQKIFVKIVFVNNANGQESQAQQISAISAG